MTKYEFKPDYNVPPGETFRETVEEQALNQAAEWLDFTHLEMEDLYAGRMEIDEQLAQKLTDYTKVSQEFWLNREKSYREFCNSIPEQNIMD